MIVRWYEPAPDSAKATPGKTRQRSRFFASAAARDEFIEQFQQHAQRADPTLPALAPNQLIRWQQAVAIAPEADPVEVFRFWMETQQAKHALDDRPLEAAAAACLTSMERIGRNRPNHLFDAECLQVVGATMLKIIGRESVEASQAPDEER